MRYLIGIDDTDNLESRGTGHRARQMAETLARMGLVQPLGITRHQLLVSPEIPYTSHNSSACLLVEADPDREKQIWDACCDFLLAESAPGSDAGLCLADWERVTAPVCEFGGRAKQVVLTQAEAARLAAGSDLLLQGLTGTHGGVIGALAGVGLHRQGQDGRFLWLPGLRELAGRLTVAEICERGHVDGIRPLDGVDLPAGTLVDVGEWVRPILRGGQAILFVEEQNNEWLFSPKNALKAFPTELARVLEALLLVGSGALVVILHNSFSLPLGQPGYHGIEWMAILILGRSFSRSRGAGSLASLGAAGMSMLPLWGATHDPFIWLVYLLPGPVMDLAFRYLPGLTGKVWFLALLGGLAHVTKPIVRLVITVLSGWSFGSFRFGVVYPISSHLLFGLIGGLLGALIVLGVRRLPSKSNQ